MKDVYKVMKLIEELEIEYTFLESPLMIRHRAIYHDKVDGKKTQAFEYHFTDNGKFLKTRIVDSDG